MNRSIEVGCLVMVVDADESSLIGKGGVVISKVSGVYRNGFYKYVDMTGWFDVDSDGLMITRPPCSLIRIDNHETSADEVERVMEKTK